MLNDSKIAFAVKWEDIEKTTPVPITTLSRCTAAAQVIREQTVSGLSLMRFSKLVGLLADQIAPRQEVQRIAPHRCEGHDDEDFSRPGRYC
jgi:hypothetical protein